MIDSSPSLDDYWENILGSVGLPTPNSAEEALYARRESMDQTLPWFAKIGLLVRADTSMLITVDETDSVAIRWGNGTRELFSRAIMTRGCSGDGWLAFPGGFRVDEPHCVGLTVTTPEGSENVQVGVGAPCPGQKPPAAQLRTATEPERSTSS